MGLHGDKFLRHGACLVLSYPLEMGGFWRSLAAHPRQNLVQCPARVRLLAGCMVSGNLITTLVCSTPLLAPRIGLYTASLVSLKDPLIG